MARGRHACNGTLGISRAPTAYALFCAHAKANWKTPARRRIKHKSSFLTKGALQKKWETMPEDEKKKFKQDATQRAARNKLLRESAAREKRVASREECIPESPGLAAESTPLLPGAEAHQFRFPFRFETLSVGKTLGEGTHGEVFVATGCTGLQFAVKVTKPEPDGAAASLQDLGTEYLTLMKLHDINVVAAYGLVSANIASCSTPRLAMILELCDCSLSHWLRNNPIQAEPAAEAFRVRWSFLLQLVTGLAHVHSKDIVHLDLKPANALVSGSPDAFLQLKLSDFGLAAGKATQLSGNAAYTPPYRPWELWLAGSSKAGLEDKGEQGCAKAHAGIQR